jgi:hypothetical protein
MAPPDCRFQTIGSDSSSANGSVTSRAAASCTTLALRTSQGATKRF